MLEAKTVSELQLAHCKLEPCNQFNFFHLKSLNLDDVYLDEQVIQNLTLNRPLIEDFQLYNCHGFKHLKISNLPRLNLFYVESRIMVSRIEIEAPGLQPFSYRNNNTNQFQNEHCGFYLESCKNLKRLFVHDSMADELLQNISSKFPNLEVS